MDDDTKKREPGCTCHQEEGDSECVVHDPPTCKRCGCEYTMEWPNTEPTTYCDACAHVVVEAAEARAERAEARISELCQCRRPEAGRDGYTCERCEDAAATAALRATVKALTAERDYLRAWHEWALRRNREVKISVTWTHSAMGPVATPALDADARAWLAANPEPQPPEGVVP